MLKRLVGSIAQERRAAGISRMVIVDRNGDFDPDFQLDVSERFLLLPQKASQFFAMLHRDFLAHPGRTIFSGAWGTMLIDGHNEIALDLNSPRQVVREGFVKAVGDSLMALFSYLHITDLHLCQEPLRKKRFVSSQAALA